MRRPERFDRGRLKTFNLALVLILWAGSAAAQDVLPFPEPPMGGEVATPTLSRLAEDGMSNNATVADCGEEDDHA